MGFIQKIIDNYKEKKNLINKTCNDYIFRIEFAMREVEELFVDLQSFIQPEMVIRLQNQHAGLAQEVSLQNIQKVKKAANYKALLTAQAKFYNTTQYLRQRINAHNEYVANTKIKNAYALIDQVEGRNLDRQQMMCIVKESHNHLVIAGAGTGKTTTIVGKIKYLLKSGMYRPEDILVLSFTHASADEMSQRIDDETGCHIDAMTFHKLGKSIIAEVNNCAPSITQLNLSKFIKEQLHENMKSAPYLKLLNTYLLYKRVPEKSEFEFNTEKEYEEYLKLNPPTTLKNEIVKSYGEMDIANFLYENGVQYIYEQPYEIDTRTSEYSQSRPDFYLPDFNMYIEYFGINRQGEVPPYFSKRNGMSATESYQSSMKWKRDIHQANHTVMIECFAYEKFEGTLLDGLQQKLKENGVTLSPIPEDKLWEQISSEDNSALDGIVGLLETVINLTKSNGYTIDKVRQLNINNNHIRINNIVLSLVEPIYDKYCDYLRAHDEIDFNDMINLAVRYIEAGRYVSPYKYVIVDEYQDISKARFSLLNGMRISNDFDLFCVGDDWQSIYRFNGSDLGFFLNFQNYWGPTEISRIETTYRFTRSLIEISGNFIMQNPAQIKKNIRGNVDTGGFNLGEINAYTDKYAVEFMIERLDDLPKDSKVFFIGRYSFDDKMLKDNELLHCQYNNASACLDVKYDKRPDLEMSFITAHKSKGLQADYVFILNNKKSRMGFPSKIQDAPILDLLLQSCDRYPYAEERRLFYVALTRAKKKAYLITVAGQESEFVMELKKRYGNQMKSRHNECPLCGGRLVKRTGQYGEFWGCSNYRTQKCTYTRKIPSKDGSRQGGAKVSPQSHLNK